MLQELVLFAFLNNPRNMSAQAGSILSDSTETRLDGRNVLVEITHTSAMAQALSVAGACAIRFCICWVWAR